MKRLHLGGVVALLAGAMLWLSLIPSHAQLPTPNNTGSDIRSEIRERAASDVENNIPRRNNDIVRLYSGQTPGLTDQEIWRIYDEEYTKLVEAKRRDPLELLNPENGWLIAFLATIVAIFREKIIGALTQLSDAISNFIFNQFAGSAFFRQKAIDRYKKALIEEYKKRKSIFQQEDQLLDLRQSYVSLQVKGKSNDRTQYEADDAIANFPRLMIVGAPGAGKSMLLWNIAVRYAEDNPIPLPGRPVPVLLNLHELNDASLAIEDQIVKALAIGFPKANQFVEQALEQGGLLLLFDGLDEVNGVNRSAVVQKVRKFLQSNSCRAIITCRKAVYEGEFANEVDRTLEIREFSDQQIRRFLEGWKAYLPPEKSVEQLIQTLRDRPQIMTLARNPLLLSIIAFLYTNPRFVLPHSRAEFYQEATEILLRKLDQARVQNAFTSISKRMVLRHLALYFQASANARQSDRLSVDYETVLAQIQQELPRLNLGTDQAKLLLDEIIARSGLLLAIDNGERYTFAHLTLQEFFAAEELREKEADLVEFFRTDRTTWRETVKLWCGLAGDSTSLIQQVLEIEPITAFECLADAQRVDQTVVETIINQFTTRLDSTGDKDAVIQAFGTVAADTRENSRGRSVFEFLKQTIAETNEPNRRLAAAHALSLTNLRSAAQLLSGYYSQWQEVRPILIRMGDLAVPELASLAAADSVEALDALMEIGTPDAARAIVPMVIDAENPSLAEKAAWRLAALLLQPGVEEALHHFPLTNEQRQRCDENTIWEWIWQPFNAPTTSTLPAIAKQLAGLLAVSPVEAVPEKPIKLDPRIVIPICSMYIETDLKGFRIERIDLATLRMFREEADRLAEQRSTASTNDADFQQKQIELINRIQNTVTFYSPRNYLFSSLEPSLQFDLLHRLMQPPAPEPDDWSNLFRPLKYDFRTSWHYRVILIIAALISAAAFAQSILLPIKSPTHWMNWSGLLFGLIITYFWLFLFRGINQSLEPSLFLSVGLLGLKTFYTEIHRLFTQGLVWDGVIVYIKTITESGIKVFYCAGIVTAVGILSFAALGIVAIVVGDISTFIMTFIIFSIFAFFVSWFRTLIGTNLTIIVFGALFIFSTVYSVIDVAGISAGVFVAIFVIAFVGLVCWLRAKDIEDEGRLLILFAFPYFCWFPIVVWLTTVALLNFLSPLAVGAIWVGVMGLCTILWQRGQKLDRRSRNPLKGILGDRV